MKSRSAIVLQARMGSTRLPGKSLAFLEGKTIVEHCVERLRSRSGLMVILATTTLPEDDALVDEASRLSVPVVRGSADDVLGRFARAATMFDLTALVRATADNPAVDMDAPRRTLELLGFRLAVRNDRDQLHLHAVAVPDQAKHALDDLLPARFHLHQLSPVKVHRNRGIVTESFYLAIPSRDIAFEIGQLLAAFNIKDVQIFALGLDSPHTVLAAVSGRLPDTDELGAIGPVIGKRTHRQQQQRESRLTDVHTSPPASLDTKVAPVAIARQFCDTVKDGATTYE